MGLKQTAFAAALLLGSAGWAMAQTAAPSTTTGDRVSPNTAALCRDFDQPQCERHWRRQCWVGAGGQQLHRRAGAPSD
jgi:hypothetical protein